MPLVAGGDVAPVVRGFQTVNPFRPDGFALRCDLFGGWFVRFLGHGHAFIFWTSPRSSGPLRTRYRSIWCVGFHAWTRKRRETASPMGNGSMADGFETFARVNVNRLTGQTVNMLDSIAANRERPQRQLEQGPQPGDRWRVPGENREADYKVFFVHVGSPCRHHIDCAGFVASHFHVKRDFAPQ